MRLYRAVGLVVLVALLAASQAHAAPAEEGEQFSAVHHSADGYYLDVLPFGRIELPRIFVVRTADGGWGLDAFASTSAGLRSGAYAALPVVHGGEEAPAAAGGEYGEEVEHAREEIAIAAEDELAALMAAGDHLGATLVPAGGGEIVVDLSITRHLVFALLAALIVAALFIGLAQKYKRGIGRETAPRGLFQNAMETMIVFIRDEVAKPNLGDYYPRYLPYLLTLFFFILVANLLGLVPFGATATSNITVTAVLALFTFVVTQASGSRDYWSHIINPPVPLLMKPIMVLVEVIGLFTKPFALAVRLFANMTAGHMIILSLIGLIFVFTNLYTAGVGWGVAVVSVLFTLFIAMLEILVALIQAYIFTVLSALFIGMALEEHDHGDEPELAEGAVPELHGEDHSRVTPHPLRGNGADMPARVRRTEPVPAG